MSKPRDVCFNHVLIEGKLFVEQINVIETLRNLQMRITELELQLGLARQQLEDDELREAEAEAAMAAAEEEETEE
jgi:hypothetical protein